MVTPLGSTFSTDEQVVAQGDVNFMGKIVESLVMECDQAKYEEFLSSGSKSPKVAWQYCRLLKYLLLSLFEDFSKNGLCK